MIQYHVTRVYIPCVQFQITYDGHDRGRREATAGQVRARRLCPLDAVTGPDLACGP